jgi:hypothetical protein
MKRERRKVACPLNLCCFLGQVSILPTRTSLNCIASYIPAPLCQSDCRYCPLGSTNFTKFLTSTSPFVIQSWKQAGG